MKRTYLNFVEGELLRADAPKQPRLVPCVGLHSELDYDSSTMIGQRCLYTWTPVRSEVFGTIGATRDSTSPSLDQYPPSPRALSNGAEMATHETNLDIDQPRLGQLYSGSDSMPDHDIVRTPPPMSQRELTPVSTGYEPTFWERRGRQSLPAETEFEAPLRIVFRHRP